MLEDVDVLWSASLIGPYVKPKSVAVMSIHFTGALVSAAVGLLLTIGFGVFEAWKAASLFLVLAVLGLLGWWRYYVKVDDRGLTVRSLWRTRLIPFEEILRVEIVEGRDSLGVRVHTMSGERIDPRACWWFLKVGGGRMKIKFADVLRQIDARRAAQSQAPADPSGA